MHRQALKSKETVLNKEYPDTLMSLYCLTYVVQETYKNTKVFYRRKNVGHRKILEEKHPTIATCSRRYSLILLNKKTKKEPLRSRGFFLYIVAKRLRLMVL